MSAIPAANLFTLLKVIGAATMAEARSLLFDVSGDRSSRSVGALSTWATASSSIHWSAAGVAITFTRHPAATSSAAMSAVREASGAPHTTRVQKLATDLLEQTGALCE